MIKLFYKIVWDNKKTMMMYIGIFLGIFLLFITFSGDMTISHEVYEQKKPDIAIIDKDNSELSKALVKQLKKDNAADLSFHNDNDRKDALFFAQIDAIVTIPHNFEKDFTSGNIKQLKLQLRPQDASGVLIEQNTNSFLSALKSYRDIDPSLTYSEAADLVSQDLDKKVNISFLKEKGKRDEDALRNLFYNFLSYVLFSIIVMTVGAALHTIYRSEILKRTITSPINSTKMNIQIVLANISFGILLWAFFSIFILISHSEGMFRDTGILHLINSFVFTLMCICFAFMITTLLSNKRNAHTKLDMYTNIFGLVGSFFGGAFLPQQFIPDNILKISHLFPTFYYVKLNDSLAAITEITASVKETILQCLSIQMLFAIAFLCIGLVIMKSKRSQDSIIHNDFE